MTTLAFEIHLPSDPGVDETNLASFSNPSLAGIRSIRTESDFLPSLFNPYSRSVTCGARLLAENGIHLGSACGTVDRKVASIFSWGLSLGPKQQFWELHNAQRSSAPDLEPTRLQNPGVMRRDVCSFCELYGHFHLEHVLLLCQLRLRSERKRPEAASSDPERSPESPKAMMLLPWPRKVKWELGLSPLGASS